ncbi:sporulation phosphorelay system protein KapB [Bacillus solitudinis]|uniref:sporulation phosphorelay system protein KapB n=1 Tax=Bacillus solitudinis TaxID=2014074 RepID=UPI000C2365BE|nr:sporulation phosphorelay system protein KapB [Bacillus solitudinis]
MTAQLVRAMYKTGVYLAELIESQEDQQRALVKIVAVLKHPTQGDLHQPKMTDVPLFHERKALAQFEKAWVPLSSMKGYEGEVVDYKLSLEQAWMKQYNDLAKENSAWAKLSMKKLEEVRKEYNF